MTSAGGSNPNDLLKHAEGRLCHIQKQSSSRTNTGREINERARLWEERHAKSIPTQRARKAEYITARTTSKKQKAIAAGMITPVNYGCSFAVFLHRETGRTPGSVVGRLDSRRGGWSRPDPRLRTSFQPSTPLAIVRNLSSAALPRARRRFVATLPRSILPDCEVRGAESADDIHDFEDAIFLGFVLRAVSQSFESDLHVCSRYPRASIISQGLGDLAERDH